MGRKNYQDIGRPLPGRRNIVLSRDVNFQAEGCEVVNSFNAMLAITDNDKEVFIIGGAGLYVTALTEAPRMLITRIAAEIEGDVLFPELNWDEWQEIASEHHDADEKNEYAFDIVEYTRK